MIQKLKPIKVQENLRQQGLLLFTPKELRRAFQVKPPAAQQFLKNHAKTEEGIFMKLRNGKYILRHHLPSPYLAANKLYEPSYVSLETALSYYSIIPEVVYSITSVTTKNTREFITPWLAFTYHKIKKTAFTGYCLIKNQGQGVLMAEPEKALVDYLYFVNTRGNNLNDRLELKKLSRGKIENYAKLFSRPGLLRLIDKVYAEYK